MELTSTEHVLLARAALASGNPDALDALVHAAFSGYPPLRDGARAILLAEARSRGITLDAPDDAPAAPADYAVLRAAFAAVRGRGETPRVNDAPRWLALAAAMRERWTSPATARAATAPATSDREDA